MVINILLVVCAPIIPVPSGLPPALQPSAASGNSPSCVAGSLCYHNMGVGTIPDSCDAPSAPPSFCRCRTSLGPREIAGPGYRLRAVDISPACTICQVARQGLGYPRPAEGSIAGAAVTDRLSLLIFLPRCSASTSTRALSKAWHSYHSWDGAKQRTVRMKTTVNRSRRYRSNPPICLA